MNKTKILTIALLLATLASGCTKDKAGHIRIFAENFTNSGAKVAVTQTTGANGEWIVDETVNLNGSLYTIQHDENGYYLSDGQNTPEPATVPAMLAIYPGSSFSGNVVTVVNNGHGHDGSVAITNLVVRFNGVKQETAFPMVAKADADAERLYFKHITGGFMMSLKNELGEDIELATLKIVAQSTNAKQNLSMDGVTAQWNVNGPTMPFDNVGENGDDPIDVTNVCEMNYLFRSGTGDDPVTIEDGETLDFCVPVNITPISRLVVTGYDAEGTQIFRKGAQFSAPVAVLPNHMYPTPTITIE